MKNVKHIFVWPKGRKLSDEVKEKIRQGHLRRGLSWVKNCEVCGKMFRVRKSRSSARFCSTKCRAQVIMPLNRAVGIVPWNKGLTKKDDKRLMKMANDRIGSKNWMWKGGVYERDRFNRREKEWQQKVFERDNWTCQKCGVKGKVLNAHHKNSWSKYPKLRFRVSNGITLCEKCHKRFHKIYGYFVNSEQLNDFLICLK